MSPGRIVGVIVWWLWIPAVYFLITGFLALFGHGLGEARQSLSLAVQEWLLPGGLFDVGSYTPLAWIYVIVGLSGTAVIMLTSEYRPSVGDNSVGVLAASLALVCLAPMMAAFWDNDKDDGRYYSSATTYYLPTKTPPSTAPLFKTADDKPATMTKAANGCQYGVHDVKACIKVTDVPFVPDWEGRTASLNGALKAITMAASTVQRVDVMEESATYLPGADADTGVWTTILDGSERIQPISGVAEWDGKAQAAQVCAFRDGYKFNRAFNGDRMNDLENYVTEYYPQLLFERSDVWGYCAGDPKAPVADRYPVIVIPVQQAVPFEVQALRAPAGVLVLKGSPSGTPAITWKPDVKAGEFPGPVYPLSIVGAQREATEWTAGRRYMNLASFGFEPATDEVQAGNTSDFLLRDRKTRRLWFVTPATPNSSKSQSIIAYTMIPADRVTSGALNPLDIHVFGADHIPVNFNDMLSDAVNYLAGSRDYSMLIPSGLKLTEFTPLTETKWRLFGEVRGVTKLYMDVTYGQASATSVATVDGSQPTTTQPNVAVQAAATACGPDPAKMKEAALVDCAAAYLDEFKRRATTATPKP